MCCIALFLLEQAFQKFSCISDAHGTYAVPFKSWQPCLIFASKIRADLSRASIMCFILIGFYHLLNGATNQMYKLLSSLKLIFFQKSRRRYQLLTGIIAAIQHSVYGCFSTIGWVLNFTCKCYTRHRRIVWHNHCNLLGSLVSQ